MKRKGKPIARLSPVHGNDRIDSRMADLVRIGYVRPPSESLQKGFWKLVRPKDRKGRVLAALLEERAGFR